jgi:hypothetical protein
MNFSADFEIKNLACIMKLLFMNKKKLLSAALGAFFVGFFWAFPAQAVCPVCTVAVGVGVGLARSLGVDDTITGTWIGGLMVSLIFWTLNWFGKKGINFKFKKIITIIAYYGLIVVPLIWFDIVGHPLNKLWGVDKLMFGIIFGSVVFFAASFFYEYVKKRNDNRALFPFQKIVMPIVALLIVSGIFYLITK